MTTPHSNVVQRTARAILADPQSSVQHLEIYTAGLSDDEAMRALDVQNKIGFAVLTTLITQVIDLRLNNLPDEIALVNLSTTRTEGYLDLDFDSNPDTRLYFDLLIAHWDSASDEVLDELCRPDHKFHAFLCALQDVHATHAHYMQSMNRGLVATPGHPEQQLRSAWIEAIGLVLALLDVLPKLSDVINRAIDNERLADIAMCSPNLARLPAMVRGDTTFAFTRSLGVMRGDGERRSTDFESNNLWIGSITRLDALVIREGEKGTSIAWTDEFRNQLLETRQASDIARCPATYSLGEPNTSRSLAVDTLWILACRLAPLTIWKNRRI